MSARFIVTVNAWNVDVPDWIKEKYADFLNFHEEVWSSNKNWNLRFYGDLHTDVQKILKDDDRVTISYVQTDYGSELPLLIQLQVTKDDIEEECAYCFERNFAKFLI